MTTAHRPTEKPAPRPPEGDWLGTPFLRFTREAAFGVCTLDRPEARNAMTPAMYFGIKYAVKHVDGDPDLAGLLITGNLVSTGGVQVFGRVVGDIHAAHLVVGKGANVEGNVRAQDVVIDGAFKGTIHGNVVKLQSTAAVEGEVYNRSLAIDQNANFEGVARRLSQPVEAPSEDEIAVKPATPALVPEQPAATAYAYTNGGYANGYATTGEPATHGALPSGQTSTY